MLGNGFLSLCSLITSTSNTYLLWGLAQVLPSPWSATRKSTDYCQKSWESEHLGVNPKRESYFTPGVSFVESSVKWSQQWSFLHKDLFFKNRLTGVFVLSGSGSLRRPPVFSACGAGSRSLLWCPGISEVASPPGGSLVAERRPLVRRLQWVRYTRLAALRHAEASWARYPWTCVPCVDWQFLTTVPPGKPHNDFYFLNYMG